MTTLQSMSLVYFYVFSSAPLEVGELFYVCAHTAIWVITGEQISGPLVLLFDWKLASSLDSNLQCLMEQKRQGAC